MQPARYCVLAILTLVGINTAEGQAPHITPQGDPSVQADTIYKLAADSRTRFWNRPSAAFLLDDGVVVFDAEGRGTRSYRQIVHVLENEAVENWAEMTFSYDPSHERLTVNWIRVLREDGTLLSDKPSVCQDSDVTARESAPVYVERKVRRCSLSQVAPGTIIDYSSTIEELSPSRPGDFLLSWRITPGVPTRRSRYIVDLPASLRPSIVEENVMTPVVARKSGDRMTRTWVERDLNAVQGEAFASDSNSVVGSIAIAGQTTWQSIGTWFAGLSKGRDSITPELQHLLDSLVSASPTRLDSLKALHRWVAQDIRYVSIALGQGGYQPRPISEVASTGVGDCKDKALLFVALARRMGFTAYPILLNSSDRVDPRLPSIEQFNHAIAVADVDGRPVYTDLTAEVVPFGELPGQDQGQFAVIVRGGAVADTIHLPMTAPSGNEETVTLTATLDPGGKVSGTFVETGTGTVAASLRVALADSVDDSKLDTFGRTLIQNYFPGAKASDIRIFNGRNLSAEPKISMSFSDGIAAKKIDARLMLLNIPFGTAEKLEELASELEERHRQFTIDAGAVIGPATKLYVMRITLPEGWTARLPTSVAADGVWGTYKTTYTQTGRELIVERLVAGRRGIYPPSSIESLVAWLRTASEDRTEHIVLETPSATP